MAEALRVGQRLRQAVAEGVTPGAAFGLVAGGQVVRTWFVGHHAPGGPLAGPETRWDLASLTKPLTTVAWCSQLVEDGRLDLAAPLGDLLPVADAALARAPVALLLTHTAGLAAHRPYFEGLGPMVLRTGRHASARLAIRRMLLQSEPESPPGAVERYSDLGFLLLEAACEAVDGPLAQAWARLPFHGPDALHFRPLPAATDARYAATERCPWRGRLLQGEVHDDNCWTLGGIAGHAGLFGTLDAALAAVMALLAGARGARVPYPPALFEGLSPRWMHPLGTFVRGFDTPTPGASSSGTRFGRTAFGHLGFTGTSFWIDPAADVAMVLLTNRVCPSRDDTRIRWLRPAVHDAAWAALEVSRET
ncbi:MAG: serine hydrolase domain-containing protein [bacterium]